MFAFWEAQKDEECLSNSSTYLWCKFGVFETPFERYNRLKAGDHQVGEERQGHGNL